METKFSREQYFAKFPDGIPADSLRRDALKQALDNRKFEIELYWKRATYFWAFIAAAFAAYFALSANKAPALTYSVACLGLIFSLAWYFVNRGSKAWQQNWETHVDLLEDEFSGPLYKLVLAPRNYRFLDLTDAYPFSVSKINQVLSLFITVVWLVFVIRSFITAIRDPNTSYWMLVAMTVLTAICFIALCKAKTSSSDQPVEMTGRLRTYAR